MTSPHVSPRVSPRMSALASAGAGGAGAGGPLDLLGPKLALHLESDVGVTAIGGKVSEWASRAGWRNTVVQAVDANRPTLVANVLNGQPAIRFSGSQWLQALAQVGVVAGDRPRMYVVASVPGAGTFYHGAMVNYTVGGLTNTGFSHSHYNADRYWLVAGNGGGTAVANGLSAGTNNVPVLFDGRSSTTAVALAVNGIDVASAAVTTGALATTPDAINVGRELSGPIPPFTGDIFQIIVVTNPTPGMHQFVLDYLAAKYPSVPIANTPSKILGSLLHADFDAADPNIVLNAGKVASIPNRGTDTAAMVQATATAQPVYGATSFAGGPGMTFDGVDDTMLCTFATPIAVGARPYMWLVFKANNTTVRFQVAGQVSGGSGTPYMLGWITRADGANFSSAIDTGNAGGFIFGPTETINTHLTEVGDTVNGVAATVFDGIPSNAGSLPCQPLTVAMTRVRLGARGLTPTEFSGCTIRRIIVANDLPSPAQITAMRDYLRSQPYGFTF